MNTSNKQTTKRLIIEVPDDFHADIKERAARSHIHLRTWVLKAIKDKILQEQKYEEEK